jgi:predicted amidohydrolase
MHEVGDLVRKSVATPAHVIGRPELGRLSVGGVVVVAEESGRFVYTDVKGARVEPPGGYRAS